MHVCKYVHKDACMCFTYMYKCSECTHVGMQVFISVCTSVYALYICLLVCYHIKNSAKLTKEEKQEDQ